MKNRQMCLLSSEYIVRDKIDKWQGCRCALGGHKFEWSDGASIMEGVPVALFEGSIKDDTLQFDKTVYFKIT